MQAKQQNINSKLNNKDTLNPNNLTNSNLINNSNKDNNAHYKLYNTIITRKQAVNTRKPKQTKPQ